jgi:NADPH:quinone reductase-like Zn-dependent oxidoreductase
MFALLHDSFAKMRLHGRPGRPYLGGMKAVRIGGYGGPEVLKWEEIAAPVAGDGEVLVKVHAASVNPIDWQIRQGLVKLFIRPRFPAILGCDLAGEVVAGKGVGDQVFAMMPHDWGAQAELVALPEELVVKKPANLSMIEAAGVGACAVTALQSLRDHAGVTSGMEVLINGASGGVGMAGVQLAKALGARVTAVCSAASFELVKGLGADRLVDYKTSDFTKGAEKYDVIFDCIGNQNYAACRPVLRGKWVHVTTMPTGRTFARLLLNPFSRGKVVAVIAKPTAERMRTIQSLLESGKLKVIVDKVLPAAAVAEAHNYSQSGRAKGKIVLSFVS